MADIDGSQVSKLAEDADLVYQQLSEDDFLTFVDGLIIPSASGPCVFAGCMESFQRDFFEDISPSIHAIRDGTMPPNRRFWMERTKKASKDSDLALCVLWLLAFTKRPILIQIVASNQKQAGIIKRRIANILHYNEWLNDLVKITQNKIKSEKGSSEAIIEATDSSSSAHGETPDLLILNELVHVAKWEVMETHMQNAAGVPMGVVIVSTNSGFKGTKAEVWRTNALENPKRWSNHIWSKFSPWLSIEDIEEEKERCVGSEFSRLWEGKWSSGKGDALTEMDIDRCFHADLKPLTGPVDGWQYVGGLDLGVSHDHAAVSIIGVNYLEQKLRVAVSKSWEPIIPTQHGTKEVDSQAVERECIRLGKLFRVYWFGYDLAGGGSFMAQSLRRSGLPMQQMTFNATNLTEMARVFIQVCKEGRLECYEDDRLRRDFGKFDIVERATGFRLVATSDEHGHADVGTALVICLPKAVELMKGNSYTQDKILALDEDDKPLSEEDMEEMPDELKEWFSDDISGEKVNSWNYSIDTEDRYRVY
jgi:hypothetical protein